VASSLNTSEAIPYIRNEIFNRFNRLKIYGLTIMLSVRNGKPAVSVRSYDEETDRISDEFNKTRRAGLESFIRDALILVKKYRYVVLESDESGAKFIQFHYGGNTYSFDFPLTPLTLNRDYSGEIIKLLLDSGFTKYNTVSGYAFKYKTYTIYEAGDDITSISADFGNDLYLAVEFSDNIFRNIFKLRIKPRARFG
jgi:hypothetical protein